MDALIILGKYPKAGNVKTRLGKNLGDEKALLAYKKIAEYEFRQIKKLPGTIKKFFLYSDPADEKLIKKWVGKKFESDQIGFEILKPLSVEINENIKLAFKSLIKRGFKKIVSVATDLPELKTNLILESFQALDKHDYVLGPEKDFGLYLYGQKVKSLKPFEIKGYDNVHAQVLEKIKSENKSYKVLNVLNDIDTLEDFALWISKNPKNPLAKRLSKLI